MTTRAVFEETKAKRSQLREQFGFAEGGNADDLVALAPREAGFDNVMGIHDHRRRRPADVDPPSGGK